MISLFGLVIMTEREWSGVCEDNEEMAREIAVSGNVSYQRDAEKWSMNYFDVVRERDEYKSRCEVMEHEREIKDEMQQYQLDMLRETIKSLQELVTANKNAADTLSHQNVITGQFESKTGRSKDETKDLIIEQWLLGNLDTIEKSEAVARMLGLKQSTFNKYVNAAIKEWKSKTVVVHNYDADLGQERKNVRQEEIDQKTGTWVHDPTYRVAEDYSPLGKAVESA